MFADLMNFDNLRRNMLEFVAIIKSKFRYTGEKFGLVGVVCLELRA